MKKITTGISIAILLLLMLLGTHASAKPLVKGIYITENSLLSSKKLDFLIQNAKSVGINTFVIDLWGKMSPHYRQQIQHVKNSGLRYVARIVVFPNGASPDQVNSGAYLNKRLLQVKDAIAAGADEVQLDYIRYRVGTPSSERNEQRIHQIIKWFKTQIKDTNVPLQIDVFGETSFKPSRSIGQNIKLFAPTIDAINPMVYPSHYEPHPTPSKQPYKTILDSLNALHKQIGGERSFHLYPFIETSNYRMPMSNSNKIHYIHEQIRAVQDGRADGWYAWSPTNYYDPLFKTLRVYKVW